MADILVNLAGIDASIFDHRKEHPCVYAAARPDSDIALNLPDWIARFTAITAEVKRGLNFLLTLAWITDRRLTNRRLHRQHSTRKIEVKQREFEIQSQFPSWYKFDLSYTIPSKSRDR